MIVPCFSFLYIEVFFLFFLSSLDSQGGFSARQRLCSFTCCVRDVRMMMSYVILAFFETRWQLRVWVSLLWTRVSHLTASRTTWRITITQKNYLTYFYPCFSLDSLWESDACWELYLRQFEKYEPRGQRSDSLTSSRPAAVHTEPLNDFMLVAVVFFCGCSCCNRWMVTWVINQELQ